MECSVSIDKLGRICSQRREYIYKYKDKVDIVALAMVQIEVDFLFVYNFFIYPAQSTSSLSSILSARSAIAFYWKIHS